MQNTKRRKRKTKNNKNILYSIPQYNFDYIINQMLIDYKQNLDRFYVFFYNKKLVYVIKLQP